MTDRIEWDVAADPLRACLMVEVKERGILRAATLDDLRKACEAVGLLPIERAEVGSGESWRIAAEALQAERDILAGQNATLRAQLAEVNEQWPRSSAEHLRRIATLEAKLAALTSTACRTTDEELCEVYRCTIAPFQATHTDGLRAVAARVRQERPGCLVERLVAAKANVIFWPKDDGSWRVGVHANGCTVPAAEVPKTIARLAGLESK